MTTSCEVWFRYGVRSEDWDERFAGEDFVFTDLPNATMAIEVSVLGPGRALDLACGEGRNAVWLAEQGWEVTAVDFSPVALAKAERLAAEREVAVTYERADVREWTAQPQAYDLVVVAYLQLPVDELREVLATISGALVPGGTLLIVGHDRDNLARGYGGPKDASVLYTVEELTSALEGLRIDAARQVERMVDTEIGPRIAIDTLVRAVAP